MLGSCVYAGTVAQAKIPEALCAYLEVKGASEALGAAIVSYYFHVKKGVGFCEELLSRYRGEKKTLEGSSP